MCRCTILCALVVAGGCSTIESAASKSHSSTDDRSVRRDGADDDDNSWLLTNGGRQAAAGGAGGAGGASGVGGEGRMVVRSAGTANAGGMIGGGTGGAVAGHSGGSSASGGSMASAPAAGGSPAGPARPASASVCADAKDKPVCDGNTLVLCDATGQMTVNFSRVYASPEACQEDLARGDAVCSSGTFKCEQDSVYVCDDARREFVPDMRVKESCASGMCNAQRGACNVCKPGSVSCNDAGDAVVSCSDGGQSRDTRACDDAKPKCVAGVCSECKVDSDPNKTGCESGSQCMRAGDRNTCVPVMTTAGALEIQFCHAGACKVTLAPGYDLDLKADWTSCRGSASQQPLGAPTAGVMHWPTALTDLVIPLSDSGWLCKLPPVNGEKNGCVIDAGDRSRDLYIWGPIESACTYSWQEMPDGIDAKLGSGCGMCMLTKRANENSGDYAFNMGSDEECRCPKVTFTALPTQKP
jgi:hypothetical protein